MSIPISELAAPFAPEQVKTRRGNFGQTLEYVEANSVIHRLNEALEGGWSFNVVDTQFEQDEVIVRCRLTINNTVREQFGGSRITRHKDTGDMISLADDLKSAASDALKKCATLAGIGLYLYQDQPGNGHNGNGNGNGNAHGQNGQRRNGGYQQRGNGHQNHAAHPQNGNGGLHGAGKDRVGNDQIARIFQAARDIGIPQARVIQLSRDNFNANISQLTPQQAEDLITIIGTAA